MVFPWQLSVVDWSSEDGADVMTFTNSVGSRENRDWASTCTENDKRKIPFALDTGSCCRSASDVFVRSVGQAAALENGFRLEAVRITADFPRRMYIHVVSKFTTPVACPP